MDEAIDIRPDIEKKYRERRVQLNKPVQYGGNNNITEKNVMPHVASMCVARIARYEREM